MRQSRKISFAALLAIVILSLVWISLKAPIGYAVATSGLYLFLILGISDELHKQFKEACYWDRKIMSELVRAWIEKDVKQVEKKPKK
jgi:hypothetical protein